MTDIVDEKYGISQWDGMDWSTSKVRGDMDNGAIRVGWNFPEGRDGEIAFKVRDAFFGQDAFVVMDRESAVEILHHLNTLLGNPLSYPPTAGGFAPSAD